MRHRIRYWLMIGFMAATGCASTPRTKYSDAVMRVFLDPESIDDLNYTRVQKALVDSGKWIVIDRGEAYRAVRREQDHENVEEPRRFESRERYAHMGKLYGVGGIVVAKAQCQPKYGWSQYLSCIQYLSIIDSRTGEIITAIENEVTGGSHLYGEIKQQCSWDESVEKLNAGYPTHFEKDRSTKELVDYKQETEERSKKLDSERKPASRSEGVAR